MVNIAEFTIKMSSLVYIFIQRCGSHMQDLTDNFKQLTNAQLVYTIFLFFLLCILKQVVTAGVCTVNV